MQYILRTLMFMHELLAVNCVCVCVCVCVYAVAVCLISTICNSEINKHSSGTCGLFLHNGSFHATHDIKRAANLRAVG